MEQNKTKPILLFTQALLNTYWPAVEHYLAGAPILEEMSLEAIYHAITRGQLFCFVVVSEFDEVELVLLLSPNTSDVTPSITILSVAGRNLRKHIRNYWKPFQGWCVMSGARAIDAYVPDHMEKIFNKLLGLKRETVHVRLGL